MHVFAASWWNKVYIFFEYFMIWHSQTPLLDYLSKLVSILLYDSTVILEHYPRPLVWCTLCKFSD